MSCIYCYETKLLKYNEEFKYWECEFNHNFVDDFETNKILNKEHWK